MSIQSLAQALRIVFLASRPKFLVASAAPVLVGSALGFLVAGSFHVHLFILALLAIMALHSGSNVANDYFDHLSRNDWLNENPTPFSGGRRFIQNGILSPTATILVSLLYLGIGSGIGLVIVALTRSTFILAIGVLGVMGGFFYTAKPIQLGYRSVGEAVIAILFGLLPVYGAYYLQTGRAEILPLLPSLIVGILIFLVILVNEFPDRPADAAVHKNTLVVRFGVARSVVIYRIALAASYLLAAIMFLWRPLLPAGLLYLLTLPFAVKAARSANKDDLAKPGYFLASRNTVIMHTIGTAALTVGFVAGGILRLLR